VQAQHFTIWGIKSRQKRSKREIQMSKKAGIFFKKKKK